MTATIGAEVGGVDLAGDLSDETIEEIREALLEWKVIFFRDQHDLDRARHVAFGRRFGDLEVHPVTPKDQEQPEVFVIPAGGDFRAPDRWHSDVTWRPEPSGQCRFRWRPGSVAFWDNLATQHLVSNDFLPAKRVMERVTVVGDKPY